VELRGDEVVKAGQLMKLTNSRSKIGGLLTWSVDCNLIFRSTGPFLVIEPYFFDDVGLWMSLVLVPEGTRLVQQGSLIELCEEWR